MQGETSATNTAFAYVILLNFSHVVQQKLDIKPMPLFFFLLNMYGGTNRVATQFPLFNLMSQLKSGRLLAAMIRVEKLSTWNS